MPSRTVDSSGLLTMPPSSTNADALLGQALRHHGKQAVALDPLAAVAEQHLPDAVPGQVLADQLLLVGTELDAGRIEESKVFHGSAP